MLKNSVFPNKLTPTFGITEYKVVNTNRNEVVVIEKEDTLAGSQSCEEGNCRKFHEYCNFG